jgi:hypothetical protein
VIGWADAAFYLIASLAGVSGAVVVAGFSLGVLAQWVEAKWLDRTAVKVAGLVIGAGIVIVGFAFASVIRNRLS